MEKLNKVNQTVLCLSVIQSMLNDRKGAPVKVIDVIKVLNMVGWQYSEYPLELLREYISNSLRQARRDGLTTARVVDDEVVSGEISPMTVTRFVVRNSQNYGKFIVVIGEHGDNFITDADLFAKEFSSVEEAFRAAWEYEIKTDSRLVKLDCHTTLGDFFDRLKMIKKMVEEEIKTLDTQQKLEKEIAEHDAKAAKLEKQLASMKKRPSKDVYVVIENYDRPHNFAVRVEQDKSYTYYLKENNDGCNMAFSCVSRDKANIYTNPSLAVTAAEKFRRILGKPNRLVFDCEVAPPQMPEGWQFKG